MYVYNNVTVIFYTVIVDVDVVFVIIIIVVTGVVVIIIYYVVVVSITCNGCTPRATR